ncbi:reverse transcriptase family protein [Pseudomonas rustica]|uniref:reverse transcriptase family protein n=1 Tax=Pseudomonas rustica TaxID=2827099 RepID=UPI003CF3C466
MKDWKPQHYRRAPGAADVPASVMAAAIATGAKTVAVQRSLPPIYTLKHLALLTQVPYPHLRDYITRKTDAYKIFRVRKRARPGQPTSFRVICVPPHSLAVAQHWIAKHVLAKGVPHSASTAFAPDCRLIDAAAPHCASRWLIKVDVQRFFESISEVDCYRVFRSLGYQPLVSLELSRICTRIGPLNSLRRSAKWFRKAPLAKSKIRSYAVPRIGHLPQGAATSPMLANLAMKEADVLLTALANRYSLNYTRYADDLTFSTADHSFKRNDARMAVHEIYGVLRRFGLAPNLTKTAIVSPRSRKIVLGLQVNQDVPRLTRDFKMKIRMHLHYLEREDVGPLKHAERRGFSAVAGMRNHLMGLAAYAAQIEPAYGQAIKARFERIAWPVLY